MAVYKPWSQTELCVCILYTQPMTVSNLLEQLVVQDSKHKGSVRQFYFGKPRRKKKKDLSKGACVSAAQHIQWLLQRNACKKGSCKRRWTASQSVLASEDRVISVMMRGWWVSITLVGHTGCCSWSDWPGLIKCGVQDIKRGPTRHWINYCWI